MASYEVLDPTAKPANLSAVDTPILTPRPETLDDKVLGILWNGRQPGPGEEILKGIAEELKKRYRIRDVLFRRKPFVGNVAPDDIITYLATRSHAVLTGVGD